MKFAPALVLFTTLLSACGLFGCKDEQKKPQPPGSEQVSVITAVPHEQLTAALPQQLDGWQVEFTPGKFTSGGNHQMSRAGANYSQQLDGNQSFFSIELVDGTQVPSVNASLAIMAHMVEDVHRVNLTVAGYSGIQQWQPETKGVTAMVVIAGRFVATLKGDNIRPEMVKTALSKMDFKKLETLAGVTNPHGDKGASSRETTAQSPATPETLSP